MDYIGYVLHDYPRTWISFSMNRMLTGLVIRHAMNIAPEQINYDDYRRYFHPFQHKMICVLSYIEHIHVSNVDKFTARKEPH